MKPIAITFYGFAGVPALAAARIATALNLPVGTNAVSLILLSAVIGGAALALAGRILYVLEHPGILRVRADDD